MLKAVKPQKFKYYAWNDIVKSCLDNKILTRKELDAANAYLRECSTFQSTHTYLCIYMLPKSTPVRKEAGTVKYIAGLLGEKDTLTVWGM